MRKQRKMKLEWVEQMIIRLGYFKMTHMTMLKWVRKDSNRAIRKSRVMRDHIKGKDMKKEEVMMIGIQGQDMMIEIMIEGTMIEDMMIDIKIDQDTMIDRGMKIDIITLETMIDIQGLAKMTVTMIGQGKKTDTQDKTTDIKALDKMTGADKKVVLSLKFKRVNNLNQKIMVPKEFNLIKIDKSMPLHLQSTELRKNEDFIFENE